jgi:hypothetical protein
MTSKSMKPRAATALLGLAVGLVAAAVSAAPGLAQAPSPAHLAEQGWTCVVPPVPGIGMACFNPGLGRPPIPPVQDGRASYTAMLWTSAGDFLGHTHLIRADLYAGQPCAQTGGLWWSVGTPPWRTPAQACAGAACSAST